jgi:hypothetical protein
MYEGAFADSCAEKCCACYHMGLSNSAKQAQTSRASSPSPRAKFYKHCTLQVDYDKKVRPNYGGVPVTVGVSLYVLSVSEISEKFMDYTFDMYFR